MTPRDTAHRAVRSAIATKRILPARMHLCVDCGRQALDYDHRDYSQPLVIAPVCRSCNLRRGPALAVDPLDHERTPFGRWFLKQPHGAGARLVRAIGIQQVQVTHWASGRRQVPAERCPSIERATDGAVTCEELRTDVRWHRVADPAWPWHPEGRPLLDVAREPEAKPAAEAV